MESTETKTITVKKVFNNKTKDKGIAWQKLVTNVGDISVFDPQLQNRLKEGDTANVEVTKKGDYLHLVSVSGSAEARAPEAAKEPTGAPRIISPRDYAIAASLRHLADLFEGKA